MKKQRLDILLVERGLAPSRTMAQALIMAGKVKSGTTVLAKPGMGVESDTPLSVEALPKYVSRGGDKLASVVSELGLDFEGKIVLDVGSSTGGFTDFALQHGASRVYAVDVGTAQLAYKLRQDPRVVVMERTDIRDVSVVTPGSGRSLLPEQPDIVVIDTSFVSLRKILPSVAKLVKAEGQIVTMAKPQFESDRITATKFKGVISDEKVRQQILQQLEADIKEEFEILGSADSKIAGAQGNLERFYLLSSRAQSRDL